MAEKDKFPRHYSEKETAKILRKAAEIQSRRASSAEPLDGISGEELRRIGAEVGLDEDAIHEALNSVEEDNEGAQARWLGAPPSYEIERVFEGQLTPGQWQALVGELNATYHQSIEGVVNGPVHTWHWKGSLGSVHFQAVQTPTSVRLKMTNQIDDGVTVGFILACCAMLIGGSGPWASPALQVWAAALLSIVIVLGIGLYFRRTAAIWYHRDRAKTSRIMDRLEEVLRSADSVRNALRQSSPPVGEGQDQPISQQTEG